MYVVSIKNKTYHHLEFYFETVESTYTLVSLAMKEGFTVTISPAVPDNDPEIE